MKFIDLFAGIGGFRLALEKRAGKCVFSSEWDANSQKTYQANFNEIPHGDITKIDAKDVPDHDLLCAGFPCQAFSISGKQKGFEDTRGTLFFDVARIVKEKKPKVLFLENVKNLTKHDSGKTLSIIIDVLEELGYSVNTKILNSVYFGVPQARERVYIVCFRKDLNVKDFKFPLGDESRVKAIRDILEKDIKKEYLIDRNDIEFYKDEFDIRSTFSPAQIGKINKGGQGERIYSIHSVGITLSAHGGGAAAKTGAYLDKGKIRKLTPLECLRMQGFPDSFKLPVSKNISYKQLGNSVSVPVIEAIYEAIEKSLKIIRKNDSKSITNKFSQFLEYN